MDEMLYIRNSFYVFLFNTKTILNCSVNYFKYDDTAINTNIQYKVDIYVEDNEQ